MKYHPAVLTCPDCNDRADILEISFAADGEIRIELACYKCSIGFNWVTSAVRVATEATKADFREQAQITLTSWKKQLPAPKFDDDKWLHELGVKYEDKTQT